MLKILHCRGSGSPMGGWQRRQPFGKRCIYAIIAFFFLKTCFTPHMVLSRNAEPEDRSPCCTQTKTHMKSHEVSSSGKTWWQNFIFFFPHNYFMKQTKYFLGDLITRYVVLMAVSRPGPFCFTNPLCTRVLEKQHTATHLRRGLVPFPRLVTSWWTSSSP